MKTTIKLVREPDWRSFHPIGPSSPDRWAYVKQYAVSNTEILKLFLSPLNSNCIAEAVTYCEAR